MDDTRPTGGQTEMNIQDYGGNDDNSNQPSSTDSGMTGIGDRTDTDTVIATDYGIGAAKAADRGGETDANKRGYTEGYDDTSANAGRGEQFGEFGNTGTGTDLTVEMENTDARSGLVKGGEEGASDAAGPGQYGGQAGGLDQ